MTGTWGRGRGWQLGGPRCGPGMPCVGAQRGARGDSAPLAAALCKASAGLLPGSPRCGDPAREVSVPPGRGLRAPRRLFLHTRLLFHEPTGFSQRHEKRLLPGRCFRGSPGPRRAAEVQGPGEVGAQGGKMGPGWPGGPPSLRASRALQELSRVPGLRLLCARSSPTVTATRVPRHG